MIVMGELLIVILPFNICHDIVNGDMLAKHSIPLVPVKVSYGPFVVSLRVGFIGVVQGRARRAMDVYDEIL